MGRTNCTWKHRPAEIEPSAQLHKLEKLFPDGKKHVTHDGFEWEYKVTPTPNSREYKLKIVYKKYAIPLIYVISPKPLMIAEGAKELEHVYKNAEQQICLYYGSKEYNNTMYLVNTIVPWASEWLAYYELWLITGEWLGGGISHRK